MKESEEDKRFFKGDTSRLLILLLLYIVQGVPYGFLMITMPVMMKKYFTYTQLGIIAFSPLGYRIKFLFSFFVDTKYIDSIGKRRTWIVPAQIIAGCIMLFLSYNIHELLEERAVYEITFMFTTIFLCLSIQDIAVDGWSLTIVKEQNLSYASSSQNAGIALGVFMSKTAYFAFNSVHFCNTYVRSWYVPLATLVHSDADKLLGADVGLDSEGHTWAPEYAAPMVDEVSFLRFWGYFIILVALYVMFFQSEEHDRVKVKEKDQIRSVKILFKAIKGFVFNKNMLLINIFWLSTLVFSTFTLRIGTVYLLEELNYSQSKYSVISFLTFVLEILLSFCFSNLIYKYPFKVLYIGAFLTQLFDFIFTNVILYNFNEIQSYGTTTLDLCLFTSMLMNSLITTAYFSAKVAVTNQIADPKLGSVHVTLLFSFHNLCRMVPQTYIYKLVDLYGLFLPNLIGCCLSTILLIFMKPIVNQLETLTRHNFDNSEICEKDKPKKE